MRIGAAGVVVTSLDALRTEDLVEVVASVRPLFHDCKHGVVDLAVGVTNGRMVKDADHVVQDLIFGDFGVVKSVDDARCDVLQDASCDLTSRLVEYVAEMVLGKEGMSGISAGGVCPDFVLVLATGVNDAAASLLQAIRSGRNERHDVGCEQAHDGQGNLFGDLVDQAFQAGDLGDDIADAANDIVAEDEDGVDLLDNGLRVSAAVSRSNGVPSTVLTVTSVVEATSATASVHGGLLVRLGLETDSFLAQRACTGDL